MAFSDRNFSILILACAAINLLLISSSQAQQFQFSKGWTPGKRSGLPKFVEMGSDGKPIQKPFNPVEVNYATNTNFRLNPSDLSDLVALLKGTVNNKDMMLSMPQDVRYVAAPMPNDFHSGSSKR